MKLIYKCGHCGAARDFDLPVDIGDTSGARTDAMFAWVMDGKRSMHWPLLTTDFEVRRWIRHPCEPGVHGIANLVAILER